MTVTPTKCLIILILGVTTNLSLGNKPSKSASNAANKINFNFWSSTNLSDKYTLSENNNCAKLNCSVISKMGWFLKTQPYIKTTNILMK